jgi:hypothetical protein
LAGVGDAHYAWPGLASLAGVGPIALDDAVARVQAATSDVPGPVSGASAVHVITTATGSLELGSVYPERVVRLSPGATKFAPPYGVDGDDSLARFGAWQKAHGRPTCGFALIRAVGALFADFAVRCVSVSGLLRLGICQRRPGGPWECAYLVEAAATVAAATDSEISAMLRHA